MWLFSPITLSHVNLILEPARRTLREKRRNFHLPSHGSLRSVALVLPYATPLKLEYHTMWLAPRHPEQIRGLHSKAGYNWLQRSRADGVFRWENFVPTQTAHLLSHIPQLFLQIQIILGPEVLGKVGGCPKFCPPPTTNKSKNLKPGTNCLSKPILLLVSWQLGDLGAHSFNFPKIKFLQSCKVM